MGAIGYAVTGGVFYNDLSSPDGSLALPNEGTTLDSCFGHSDAVSQFKKSLKVSVKSVHIVCVYQTGNRDYVSTQLQQSLQWTIYTHHDICSLTVRTDARFRLFSSILSVSFSYSF
jgi:hypothetical protein